MTRRVKLTGQIVAVGLVGALLALLIWKVAHGSGKTAEPKNFNLPRLDKPGTKLELSALRGKVVVLNFMASWCVPCKQEAPAIEKVWQQYKGKGVVVVGVDSEDFSGDAKSFIRKYKLTYPVVREEGNDLYGPYGVSGVPETRVIDRQGKYAGTQFYGATTATDLRQSINEALRT
ncbi:MAG TPA: TlpA disulfide reductase family protein [Gaiellaceae bacterium]|jgi:thiol-disulfide isomerase/thioredoxin|nr:TlpA disulfide reductase family protein [Gaiellaceae bacterium]